MMTQTERECDKSHRTGGHVLQINVCVQVSKALDTLIECWLI